MNTYSCIFRIHEKIRFICIRRKRDNAIYLNDDAAWIHVYTFYFWLRTRIIFWMVHWTQKYSERAILFHCSATCHNVGITALAAGLLAADHGPLGMERATEHSSCAVNHKTKKKSGKFQWLTPCLVFECNWTCELWQLKPQWRRLNSTKNKERLYKYTWCYIDPILFSFKSNQ